MISMRISHDIKTNWYKYIAVSLISVLLVFGGIKLFGDKSDPNLGDDITTEIRQSISNLEQATRDQSIALELINKQNEVLQGSLERVGRLEAGISRVEDNSKRVEYLVAGVLNIEQSDRDYIIESAVLNDRHARIVESLRKESGEALKGN